MESKKANRTSAKFALVDPVANSMDSIRIGSSLAGGPGILPIGRMALGIALGEGGFCQEQ